MWAHDHEAIMNVMYNVMYCSLHACLLFLFLYSDKRYTGLVLSGWMQRELSYFSNHKVARIFTLDH